MAIEQKWGVDVIEGLGEGMTGYALGRPKEVYVYVDGHKFYPTQVLSVDVMVETVLLPVGDFTTLGTLSLHVVDPELDGNSIVVRVPLHHITWKC